MRPPISRVVRLVLILPLIVLLTVAGYTGGQTLQARAARADAYHDAEIAYAAGDLLSALDGFTDLGTYRDASTQAAEITASLEAIDLTIESARALGLQGDLGASISTLLPVVDRYRSYNPAVQLLADLRLQYTGQLLSSADRAERASDWTTLEADLTTLLDLDPSNAVVAERLATVRRNYSPIVYARDGVLYLTNPSGSDEVALTPALGVTWPQWSPTREQITFIQRPPGGQVFDGTLYVVDRDGSNLRPLAQRVIPFYWPSWSPDGHQIAFASAENFDESRDEGTVELHVLDLTTGIETDLTGDTLPHAYSPSWSPDGSSIAFVSYRLERRRDGGLRATDGEVYTVDLSTRTLTDVTRGRIEDEGLITWSPVDNRLLIFTIPDDWNNPRQSQILILDLVSDDITEVPTHAWQLAFPAWSPDGSRIAYVEGDNVVRIWSEGHDDWIMVDSNLSPYLSWSTDSSAVFAAAETPGTSSYIIPVGTEEFGARTAFDLSYDGNDSSGPPSWSPMTLPPRADRPTVGGTAFDTT